jgi:hypothetical protein
VGQIDFSIRHQHTISYFDEDSAHSNARLEGATGCEVYAKVDGEAPTTVDEMKFLGTCSASPYVVKYDASKAGKMAYYWLRWVNRKGETGQVPKNFISSTVVGASPSTFAYTSQPVAPSSRALLCAESSSK